MSVLAFRNRLAIVLIALCSLIALPGQSLAQEPASVDCALPPVSLPLFDATPASEIAATPPGTDDAVTDVDPEEIRTAVEVIVACINSDDAASRYAVFTERYLAEQLADPTQTYQPQFEQQLAAGQTQPLEAFTLIDVSNVTPMGNGLVSVVAVLSGGTAEYRDTLILAHVDGHWLIDSIAKFDPPR